MYVSVSVCLRAEVFSCRRIVRDEVGWSRCAVLGGLKWECGGEAFARASRLPDGEAGDFSRHRLQNSRRCPGELCGRRVSCDQYVCICVFGWCWSDGRRVGGSDAGLVGLEVGGC